MLIVQELSRADSDHIHKLSTAVHPSSCVYNTAAVRALDWMNLHMVFFKSSYQSEFQMLVEEMKCDANVRVPPAVGILKSAYHFAEGVKPEIS